MNSMDVYGLKRGDRLRTTDRAVAEILNETHDGQWIGVRFVESDEDPSIPSSAPKTFVTEDERQEPIGTE
jgi:hypothetical protein